MAENKEAVSTETSKENPFVFWGLLNVAIYSFPFPFNWLFNADAFEKKYNQWQSDFFVWLNARFFHFELYPENWHMNGSSDTPPGYFYTFFFVVITGLITLWLFKSEKFKSKTTQIFPWLYFFARCYLFCNMVSYGFAKVIPNQFSEPPIHRMYQPLGHFSPVALLWNFMGSSKLYTIFGGLAEVLPALFLLSRRYTFLGALLIIPVMINIFMLNMSYDVCVKVHSFQLLFAAFLLIAPNLPALWNFFNLKPAAPLVVKPIFTSQKNEKIFLVLTVVFLLFVFQKEVSENIERRVTEDKELVETKYYGGWVVESVNESGLTKDWYRVIFTSRNGFVINKKNGQVARYKLDYKTVENKEYPVGIQDAYDEKAPKEFIKITQTDNKIFISGQMSGEDIELTAQFEKMNFLLKDRGFRWVSDVFYSR
jgi:hypothetical protein